MKHYVPILVLFVGLGLSSVAVAQVKKPTVVVGPHSTANQINPNKPVHDLNMRFFQMMKQIQIDQKSGKFTQNQATQVREKLKAIKTQELGLMKQDTDRKLTSAQITQLNSQLDQIALSL